MDWSIVLANIDSVIVMEILFFWKYIVYNSCDMKLLLQLLWQYILRVHTTHCLAHYADHVLLDPLFWQSIVWPIFMVGPLFWQNIATPIVLTKYWSGHCSYKILLCPLYWQSYCFVHCYDNTILDTACAGL